MRISSTPEEITALFARRHEALSRGDAVAFAADFAETAVIESPAYGRLVGHAAVENADRSWFAAFPDVTYSFGELLIAGDRVVDTITLRGTDTGGFFRTEAHA